jgi:hypothetical protein
MNELLNTRLGRGCEKEDNCFPISEIEVGYFCEQEPVLEKVKVRS